MIDDRLSVWYISVQADIPTYRLVYLYNLGGGVSIHTANTIRLFVDLLISWWSRSSWRHFSSCLLIANKYKVLRGQRGVWFIFSLKFLYEWNFSNRILKHFSGFIIFIIHHKFMYLIPIILYFSYFNIINFIFIYIYQNLSFWLL